MNDMCIECFVIIMYSHNSIINQVYLLEHTLIFLNVIIIMIIILPCNVFNSARVVN